MWNLIMSNLITVVVTGIGILIYHFYKEYKQKQFINRKIDDLQYILSVSLKLSSYFLLIKAMISLDNIMTILSNNHHNNHHNNLFNNQQHMLFQPTTTTAIPTFSVDFLDHDIDCPHSGTSNKMHKYKKLSKKHKKNKIPSIEKDSIDGFNDIDSDTISLDINI